MTKPPEGIQTPAFTFRNRACSLCGKNASHQWLPARVDFSSLDGFAFASRKLPEYMHFDLAICDTCDLVFAHNVPENDWFSSSYANADFDAESESSFAAATYGRELSSILHLLKTKEAALDIGAGDGAFLDELLRKGFSKVVGIEPSREPVKRAPAHLQSMLINEFFDANNFTENSFDLITCFQTLEHVESPQELFASAYKLLKPGGIFVVVAHNFRAPMAKLMGKKSPIYDIEHLQLFSPKSLQLAFEKNKFVEVQIKSIQNTYPISYWLKLFPLPLSLKQFMLRRISNTGFGNILFSAKVGNILGFGLKNK